MAFVNTIFQQQWRIEEKSKTEDFLSVLIPARNEESNIASILSDLLQLNYRNMQILVFNDQSTDGTEMEVARFAAMDERVRLINSPGLPEGWLGKNFACHSLAAEAKGEYYLFLDADVRVKNRVLIDTLGFMRKYKLGLLSIFPIQIMRSLGERISVPVMHYILLTLLPLILVRKLKRSSLAAANGQFMLFNSKIYKEYEPHNEMKDKRVEDIEIARFLKHRHVKIACVTGKKDIECRMYRNFDEAIHGFSKNVNSFFGNSYFLSIIFWLISTLGFIPIALRLSVFWLLAYITMLLLTRLFVSLTARQNIALNICLLPMQQIALGLFIYKAILNSIRKQYEWKDRNISY